MLPLFALDLPTPLTAYNPELALPDFAARVEKLQRWQQAIASGYVTSQKEEALQAEFLHLVFGQALGYEHCAPASARSSTSTATSCATTSTG